MLFECLRTAYKLLVCTYIRINNEQKKNRKLIWIFLFLRVSNDRTSEREARSHRHRRQVRIHRLHRVPSPLHFTTHIKTQSHIRNAPSTWESWIKSFCAVDTWGSQSWERYERERGRIAVMSFVIAASQANDLNDCPSPSPSPYVSHTHTHKHIRFHCFPRSTDFPLPHERCDCHRCVVRFETH